jgi:hypothetical protein
MTRIFTDGAEMGDILFFDLSASVYATTNSPVPQYSTWCYGSSNNSTGRKFFTALDELYFRGRFRLNSGNSSYTRMPSFYSDNTEIDWVGVDNANHISANSSAGLLLASTDTPLSNGRWYLIECYLKIGDNPNGRFVIYVDGTKHVDFTGDTKPGANATVNNIHIGNAGGNDIAYDDLALNNTSGLMDNSWCGDGIVVKITPSGSGTVNNWSNSGSVSGSANYLYVDEYPSDTTTYTYCSASSTGVKDKYAMSNLGGGIGSITRIFSEARIKKEVADSTTIKLGYLPNGGTDTMSGSVALYTTYAQAIGTSASANPVTGLAWTVADVNALEYVIEMS